MRCQEIREQFSPWLDGQLNPPEAELLEAHLAECAECRDELVQWQQISNALKSLGQETEHLQAPAGFEARVMQQVSRAAQRRRWLNHTLRKLVATAAAFALLAYGSLELAPRVFNGDPISKIADQGTPGQPPEGNTGLLTQPGTGDNPGNTSPGSPGPGLNPNNSDPAANNNLTPPTNNSPPLTEEPAVSSDPTGTSEGDMNTPNPDNNSAQPENNFSMARADTQFKEPMVFLNKERTITSTLLCLKVGDLAAAQSKAQAVGQEIGAQSKVFAVQSSGEGQRTIIRFVVPRDKASDFIAQLASSGSVLERQDENQDITQRFTATLEQYRALVAQLNESQNQQQKTQLNEQIKSLEQQLLAWDEEADDQIIMLSLET
ncbi:MAG: hypothetical protein GX755_02750 [Syntrophomonadaceae bacterium]|nr:hypothetical protein [Syntrophomonadaceae bacterium]